MLAASFPFIHMGSLDIGLPIQSFGVIVAIGVLIGASLLRRYAEWHGVSDEHIRGLTGWVTVAGFLGAHLFDVLAYQWKDLQQDPILLFKLWAGISSYGGFIGGAVGFAIYVWWKRLPTRLMADITIVGLLPAFSIGRIGCTVVSDHIGAVVDRAAWYAGLAMNYPTDDKHVLPPIRALAESHPKLVVDQHLLAWNLGLVEFLYLVPVNLLVLALAFRKSKEQVGPNAWRGAINAGIVTVLTGLLYAPVRFGLDFLRPEDTDPRYLGLTFAQWASFLAFGAAAFVLVRILMNGKPAETITQTAAQAQQKLKLVLNETPLDPEAKKPADDDKKPLPEAKATVAGKRSSGDGDAAGETAEK